VHTLLRETTSCVTSTAPPPGDIVRRSSKSQPRADLARQKSKRNFFDDAFSANTTSPARDRVHGDAIVMAEVKTNVMVYTSPLGLAAQHIHHH
jgi:hypothetical protein